MINRLLKQAAEEGLIRCPSCSQFIEPDCNECSCGWNNILIEEGLI